MNSSNAVELPIETIGKSLSCDSPLDFLLGVEKIFVKLIQTSLCQTDSYFGLRLRLPQAYSMLRLLGVDGHL